MQTPIELAVAKRAIEIELLEARPLAANDDVMDGYEKDLISFIGEHKMLALQFAIIVGTPIFILAYHLGRWHVA